MGYQMDFSVVFDHFPQLLWGCLGTLGLAFAGMTLASSSASSAWWCADPTLPALRLAGDRVRRDRSATRPSWCRSSSSSSRCRSLGLRLNPTVTAIIALGINGGAYAIEIIRGGVQSIHKGQVEAGLALGLHKAQVFRLIVLKPALRAIYPSLTSQFIMLTLTTSICIRDRRLRADLGRPADRERYVPQLRGLFHRHPALPGDLLADDDRASRSISRRFFSYPVK